MRRFGKLLGRVLAGMAILVATLWVLGPYEKADLGSQFDPAQFNNDLDRYFAQQEALFEDITSGVEKRVVWAGEPGAQTLYSVLYIQGFSATSEEIRPVPDKVAAALGANLVYTRLQGHGRFGSAMGGRLCQAECQMWPKAWPQRGSWVKRLS